MDISIIIPAYNEQNKISTDIFAADNFISTNNFAGEIIIVDDGSSDNTYDVAISLKEKIQSKLIVLMLDENFGKGRAVREGIINSSGNIVMYADSGLTIPFENALTGIKLIKDALCDIANGSRKMKGSKIIKGQDIDRRFISTIFNFLVKYILNIPKEMTDTQCGFKIYKGDVARRLFEKLNINGFLFEIELIQLAIKEKIKIIEFPVAWKCDRDSRLSVSKSSKRIFYDFILLFKKK